LYIPEILEGEARGRLRRLYHTLKVTLHIPFVHDLFRSLAWYPTFLTYATEASRPNLLSLPFEQAADELRTLLPPDLHPPPLDAFVTSHDVRGAQSLLPIFQYANPKLLLLATVWHHELSARPISGWGDREAAHVPPGIPGHFPTRVPLLRVETAPAPVHHLLQRITVRHRTFAPTSDYRALAYYPTFLSSAWQTLDPLLDTDWYRQTERALSARAEALARELPYTIGLTPSRLLRTMSERDIAACIALISTCRHTLPALILDIELMSRLLHRHLGLSS